MTVTLSFPARGATNPDTRTGGREDAFRALADEINGLVAVNISAENIFGVNTQSSAVDIALTSVETTQNITFTTDSRDITLPAANGASSNMLYDGGRYVFNNAGFTNYEVKNNGGTAVMAVAANQTSELICVEDSTTNGSYLVNRYYDQNAALTQFATYYLAY